MPGLPAGPFRRDQTWLWKLSRSLLSLCALFWPAAAPVTRRSKGYPTPKTSRLRLRFKLHPVLLRARRATGPFGCCRCFRLAMLRERPTRRATCMSVLTRLPAWLSRVIGQVRRKRNSRVNLTCRHLPIASFTRTRKAQRRSEKVLGRWRWPLPIGARSVRPARIRAQVRPRKQCPPRRPEPNLCSLRAPLRGTCLIYPPQRPLRLRADQVVANFKSFPIHLLN
jgi:hypothetical protein